ncbi:MAG: glycosyl transferase, family 9 [Bacteroidota bacterium]|nr:glycosyl transferase, family 9 [Bacteroidota bacterium]
MKLKTKIVVDRVAGLPIVYLLNILARILGFILRIDHSLDRPVKTIAICKFVGMGSIVQCTPLIKTLRIKYPSAKIIFVTNQSNATLFKYIDGVDEVFTVSDKGIFALISSSLKLLFKLWGNRPDTYIDMEIYSNYSSVITTMSLARNRMGFFKDDKMYRKGMYTHMLFFNIKSPVSQTYLQFARIMGASDPFTEVTLNAGKIEPALMTSVKEKIDCELARDYIVINPNASDLRLERRWPSENVVQLISILAAEYPQKQIVLIGDKNESKHVGFIASQVASGVNLIDSSGKLSLHELIALIKNAELLITNDTGPMHLAFALNTKTVSLFGPCSPQQYGGTKNTISIYKNVYCSPCVHEFLIPPCNGNNQCMKKINVLEVSEAVSKALRNEFEKTGFTEPDYLSIGNVPLGLVLR